MAIAVSRELFSLKLFRMIAAGLVVGLLGAGAAQAQATRTWVSGVGDDANPCSRTAPCKTFAGAYSKTAVGGEIDVLDPGGFGAVTISKSLSIEAEGVIAGVLVGATNAIVVNTQIGDNVTLRGLTIEGIGQGLDGVKFIGAGSLYVENCTINNFTQKGINFAPAVAGLSHLFVYNTKIRNNNNATNGGGIAVAPSGAGVSADASIENTQITHNLFGINALDNSTVNVKNSTASANQFNGFSAVSNSGGPAVMFVTNSFANDQGLSGIHAKGATATVFATGNSLSNNVNGFFRELGGHINTFTNNSNNSTNTPGPPDQSTGPQ